jgi:hypothetical protein
MMSNSPTKLPATYCNIFNSAMNPGGVRLSFGESADQDVNWHFAVILPMEAVDELMKLWASQRQYIRDLTGETAQAEPGAPDGTVLN